MIQHNLNPALVNAAISIHETLFSLQQDNDDAMPMGKRVACRVELRFDELKYKLIWKLQADELVDRNLTPQTKASIRIVLGKLEQFAANPPV